VTIDGGSVMHSRDSHSHQASQSAPKTLQEALALSDRIAEGHPSIVRAESKAQHLAPSPAALPRKIKAKKHYPPLLPGAKQELLSVKRPDIFGEGPAEIANEEAAEHSDLGESAEDASKHRVAGGRRRVQCWHMCNSAHKPEEYNGCTYGDEKRDKLTKLIEDVRATRCEGINTVQGDAEDTCEPGHGCSGSSDSIDSDIGACVPTNKEDNTICAEFKAVTPAPGVIDTSQGGPSPSKTDARHTAGGLLLPALLAAAAFAT